MTQKKIKQEQEKIKWVLMKSLGKKYINNNNKKEILIETKTRKLERAIELRKK